MKLHAPPVEVTLVSNSELLDVYMFTADHGQLDASFAPDTSSFRIDDLRVEQEFRRNGIGKMLVRSALSTAREIGAGSIGARLLSRECCDVMRDVFGDAAVRINTRGNYTSEGFPDEYDARGVLWVQL